MSDLTKVTAADEEPAEASEPSGARAALRRRLTETTTWTFLILLGIVAGFAALRFQQFATVFNFRNIAADASGLLIIAVGMTFVIITAGIDLSVGSVLVFSGVIAAKVMVAIGGEGSGAIRPGWSPACSPGGLGRAERRADQQGQDPPADRHPRHARHGARVRPCSSRTGSNLRTFPST